MKKTVSVITIILGLVVIIMGLALSPNKSNVDYDSENYYAGYHSVKSAAFGADFYTYTYDALETIVDELSSVETGMYAMVSAQNKTNKALKANTEAIRNTNTAYKMIVVSIGIGLFCYGLNGVANASGSTNESVPTYTSRPYTPPRPVNSKPDNSEPSKNNDSTQNMPHMFYND